MFEQEQQQQLPVDNVAVEVTLHVTKYMQHTGKFTGPGTERRGPNAGTFKAQPSVFESLGIRVDRGRLNQDDRTKYIATKVERVGETLNWRLHCRILPEGHPLQNATLEKGKMTARRDKRKTKADMDYFNGGILYNDQRYEFNRELSPLSVQMVKYSPFEFYWELPANALIPFVESTNVVDLGRHNQPGKTREAEKKSTMEQVRRRFYDVLSKPQEHPLVLLDELMKVVSEEFRED